MRWLAVLALVFSASRAMAFPENVTHGYANCMACHVSPSGGGVLNDYGRSLSRELMSTWGWAGSEEPLFGLLKNRDNLKWGGDVRAIQTYFENDNVDRGRFFLMQQNIEVAYRWAKTWFVATLGTLEGPDGVSGQGRFLSERHYALFQPVDNVTVRAGKFRLNYGINDPNHTRVTKRELGFGALSETYNLEVGYFGESSEVFLSTSLGRLDEPRVLTERSFSATGAQYIGEASKIGASALIGESTNQRRFLTGIWGIIKPWHEGVFLWEVDYQSSHAAATPNRRDELIATHARLGQWAYKGVLPYVLVEYLHRRLDDPDTRLTAPGVGIQFQPLPHFEIHTEYQYQMSSATPGNPGHSGWILFHFYL